jgi:hypothetical protein
MLPASMTHEPSIALREPQGAVRLSLGIIVRNEEETIGRMLFSLFRQSLFEHLAKEGSICEIICVANGCTDRTADIAEDIFAEQTLSHPFRGAFRCRVESLPRPGKLRAWNEYVQRLSAREAGCLFLADGDIVIHRAESLWNMLLTLEQRGAATAVTDEPLKDIAFKPRKTWTEKLSLAASRMTRSQPAQLTGQLYGIRSAIARNIYLPKDLTACEDGFIKTVVCTCFLTRPARSGRVVKAREASHIFEPYMGLGEILRNQKRQMIGQTVVHILVDQYLPGLRLEERLNLAETLEEKDRFDPDWLKRLVQAHMERIGHFGQLFPGALSFRLARLAGIRGFRKIGHLPAAVLGLAISALSCLLAYRFLRQGFQSYWPETERRGLREFTPEAAVKAALELTT